MSIKTKGISDRRKMDVRGLSNMTRAQIDGPQPHSTLAAALRSTPGQSIRATPGAWSARRPAHRPVLPVPSGCGAPTTDKAGHLRRLSVPPRSRGTCNTAMQPGNHTTGESVPRYKFSWSNLPPPLLRALCRDLFDANPGQDPAALPKAAYGARPTGEFIREAWPTLLESWLKTSKDSRKWIVDTLRQARGEKEPLSGRNAPDGVPKKPEQLQETPRDRVSRVPRRRRTARVRMYQRGRMDPALTNHPRRSPNLRKAPQ